MKSMKRTIEIALLNATPGSGSSYRSQRESYSMPLLIQYREIAFARAMGDAEGRFQDFSGGK